MTKAAAEEGPKYLEHHYNQSGEWSGGSFEQDLKNDYQGQSSAIMEITEEVDVDDLVGSGDDDEDDHEELPQDVFMMAYLVSWRCPQFYFPVLVLSFQITILLLVLIDLIVDPRGEEDDNKINVAPIVRLPVTIAQAMALFIVVLSQDDVTTSLFMLSLGMGTDFAAFQRSLQERYPGGAQTWQWLLANFMRLSEGLLVIVTSFVFIVQADNVLDIFMNFAAIEFVSELDNLGFQLAKDGWVGPKLKKLTREIEDEKVPIKRKFGWVDFVNGSFLLGIMLAMYAGWGRVVKLQNDGHYIKQNACSIVEVKFGDEVFIFPKGVTIETTEDVNGTKIKGSSAYLLPQFNPDDPPDIHYAFFSGDYAADFENKAGIEDPRPVYYETPAEGSSITSDDSTLGIFYYCKKESAWVWSVRAFVGTGVIPRITMEHCKYGWLLKSPITQAVTLEDVPGDNWRVWTGSLGFVGSPLSFTCVECNADVDCGLDHGTCSDETSKCECNEGYAGMFCDQVQGCETIVRNVVDRDEEVVHQVGPYYYAGEAYRRPYYARLEYLDREQGLQVWEIFVYSGSRWFYLYVTLYADAPPNQNSHTYWGGWTSGRLLAYTERTDKYRPTGPMKMYWIGDGEAQSMGSYGPFGREKLMPSVLTFECLSVDCSSSSRLCGPHGECNDNQTLTVNGEEAKHPYPYNATTLDKGGKCMCKDGYWGHYCEFKPSNATPGLFDEL